MKRVWLSKNPAKKAAANRAWLENNRGRHVATVKAWKKANPVAMKKYRLARYGLTVEEYEALLAAQGGRCAICETDTPAKHGSWCIDHCHGSSEVRGLLCVRCNAGLGHFDDSPAFLLAAERYIQASRRKRLKAV